MTTGKQSSEFTMGFEGGSEHACSWSSSFGCQSCPLPTADDIEILIPPFVGM